MAKHLDTTPGRKEFLPYSVRVYLYRILLALTPILTTYGVMAEQHAALWAGLASAILGLGTATAYTQRETGERNS